MATSFGALCTDFYVNQKVALKMDLPCDRETIMSLFDRVRKVRPSMEKFRRYDDELALESKRREDEYTWLALRQTNIRTGHVNPQSMEDMYDYHRLILEVVPYYLSLSPLDIDYLELMFGFDLECRGNHDEVVYDALFADSPLADLLNQPLAGNVGQNDGHIIDVQPVFRATLGDEHNTQAMFEIKTRERTKRGSASRTSDDPISLFVSLRRFGPINHIDDLTTWLSELGHHCETLATDRLLPKLLTPIARQITSSSA